MSTMQTIEQWVGTAIILAVLTAAAIYSVRYK